MIIGESGCLIPFPYSVGLHSVQYKTNTHVCDIETDRDAVINIGHSLGTNFL